MYIPIGYRKSRFDYRLIWFLGISIKFYQWGVFISITRPKDWFKNVALRWIDFGYELGYGWDWGINK